jgi:UDP-N-acetylglucosamine acyltransferase
MTKVHPSAVIDKNVELGDEVEIGPNCVVEAGVSIGSGTILDANVVLCKNVKIGSGNHFFPNCAIGCNPQMLGMGRDEPVGDLTIGDRNVVREQVTIHPGTQEGTLTQIGSDNLLMVGVHIGHDCILGDQIVMSNYVQISGHCNVGTGVWFSGMALSHQFVTIGKWSYASGLSGINRDIPPFVRVLTRSGSRRYIRHMKSCIVAVVRFLKMP